MIVSKISALLSFLIVRVIVYTNAVIVFTNVIAFTNAVIVFTNAFIMYTNAVIVFTNAVIVCTNAVIMFTNARGFFMWISSSGGLCKGSTVKTADSLSLNPTRRHLKAAAAIKAALPLYWRKEQVHHPQ